MWCEKKTSKLQKFFMSETPTKKRIWTHYWPPTQPFPDYVVTGIAGSAKMISKINFVNLFKTVRMWVTKNECVKQKQLLLFITISTFDYFGKVDPISTDFFHSDNHQCEPDRWNFVPISIFFHRISDLNLSLKLPSVIDDESLSILWIP